MKDEFTISVCRPEWLELIFPDVRTLEEDLLRGAEYELDFEHVNFRMPLRSSRVDIETSGYMILKIR